MMAFNVRWFCAPVLMALALPGLAFAQSGGPPPPLARPVVGEPHELGVFRTVCRYSHSRPDDPIVSPNRFNASHMHDFFGNVTTAADSTPANLLAGDTSCVTAEDHSAYWVPALTREGESVKPTGVTVYYRGTRQDGDVITPFPAGFRMIAGDSTATTPQARAVVAWSCRGDELSQAPTDSPPTCPEDSELNLHLRFPNCWDGASADSADHKSHMAYDVRGVCPADHAVHTPRIAMIVHYPIVGDPGQLRLSSGSVNSAHADFFNAWQQDFLAGTVNRCLTREIFCGTLATAPRPRLRAL